MGGWAESLGGLDATHHMAAGHLVTFHGDNEATCLANFQAQHVLTEQDGAEIHWILGGRYEFGLRRIDTSWRIATITMTAVWDDGDETIFERAGA